MSIIGSILDNIDQYVLSEEASFFIMEPRDYPCFLQFAKVGENFLLDIPTSNFFDSQMLVDLKKALKERYRKELIANQDHDEAPILSYQVRFAPFEVNKMCYIAREVLVSIFLLEEDYELVISTR
jgi:hypothetical protein